MAHELLCIGLLTLDIVARPIDALPEGEGTTLIDAIALAPAGTAGGAAMVAAKLGLNVGLAGVVGDDLAGRLVRLALDEEGVDVSLVTTRSGRRTSTTLLPIDSRGRRPNFHAPGAGFLADASEAVVAAACKSRFLHYGGVGGPKLDGGPAAALLAKARASGSIVTCDLISPGPGALDELRRLLPHVDVFMPSATEARSLSGATAPGEAAAFFRSLGARKVVIKLGGEGAHLDLGDSIARIPAHDIIPVDTTSCGDSFCAGFIAGLARGMTDIDAARLGTAVAAQVAQGLGTLGTLEGYEASVRLMNTAPVREVA